MAPSEAGPPLTGPGVLVAEDEPVLRKFLEEGLRRDGFVVWAAASGREAVDLFDRHGDAIRVALLDVRMPGLDGPQTFRLLRGLRPDLPCCFMSGDTGSYTEQDLIDLGAALLFRKPFSLTEVARFVRHLADCPQRRGEARVPVSRTPVSFGGQRGWLRDRSHSGLGLWSPEPLAVGTLLQLQVDDRSGATLPCLLEVTRCQPDVDGWTVGCRFTS
jgi:DNA-binding response OmpR family regulator